MKRKDRRQSLSETEDRAFVAHLGEDALEIVGKGQPGMGGDKQDGVLHTIVPLASNHVQYEHAATTCVEFAA